MKPYTECGAGRDHYSRVDAQIGNDTFPRRDAHCDQCKETGGGGGYEEVVEEGRPGEKKEREL